MKAEMSVDQAEQWMRAIVAMAKNKAVANNPYAKKELKRNFLAMEDLWMKLFFERMARDIAWDILAYDKTQ